MSGSLVRPVTRLPPYRVILFGTDEFAGDILRHLNANKWLGSTITNRYENKNDKNYIGNPDDDVDISSSSSSSSSGNRRRRLIRSLVLACKPDHTVKGKPIPMPAKRVALELGIDVHDVPRSKDEFRRWELPESPHSLYDDYDDGVDHRDRRFDVAIVASFGAMIPKRMIRSFTDTGGAVMNLHPSLLPRYRGATPLQNTILNQDEVTALSVIKLSADAFDGGDVLMQKLVPVPRGISAPELGRYLAPLGGECIVSCLDQLHSRWHHAVSQDVRNPNIGTIHTQKLVKADADICWQEMGADVLRIRMLAIAPYYKGLLTYFGCTIIKIEEVVPMRVEEPDLSSHAEMAKRCGPGWFVYQKESDTIWAACADGGWLGIKQLKVAGSNSMTPEVFSRKVMSLASGLNVFSDVKKYI